MCTEDVGSASNYNHVYSLIQEKMSVATLHQLEMISVAAIPAIIQRPACLVEGFILCTWSFHFDQTLFCTQ